MRLKPNAARYLLVAACLPGLLVPATPASAHSSSGFPKDPGSGDLQGAAGAGNDAAFINFETPHVHPIDISPDGLWLAACNTPDGRVEVYSINQTTGALTLSSSVTVGVDPVSVRFRTNDEIWAVNAVSDSISIIDRTIGQVTDTIVTYRLVSTGNALEGSPNGDRPMDVVFIESGTRAVVSCTSTDILQVYDTGTRELTSESLRVDGEEPRALTTDGTNVWGAIFESGNGTTLISGIDGAGSANFPPESAIQSSSNPYGGPPAFGEYLHVASPGGDGWMVAGVEVNPGDMALTPPRTSVIVRSDGAGAWLDDNGRNWALFVDGANAALSGRRTGWTLLDNDVVSVEIDPDDDGGLVFDSGFGQDGYVHRQMNIVMAIARNPVTGEIWSVGTDATNEIRFEPNITGTFVRVKLSVVNPGSGAQVLLTDVNEAHLDAAQPGSAYSDSSVPQSERNKSLGDPRGIAFTADGQWAYISGMGSNNLILVDAAGGGIGNRFSAGFTIEVPQGPTGLVHRALNGGTVPRLYVLSKFASQISVLNTATPGSEILVQTVNLYDPTPSSIKAGRVHLYGTHENSGLGQIACASCHVDVRMDRLGWNLGNPAHIDPLGQGIEKRFRGEGDGLLINQAGPNPAGVHNSLFVPEAQSESSFGNFSSAKGVMTTQTLQDIIGKEPHHWRGDRDGIEEFAGAFAGLQGRDADLDGTSMAQFKAFLASTWFEPNPMRPLDNALPGGPPLSEVFSGNHDNLRIATHFSPGTTTGKGGFSALGNQLPPGNAFQGFVDYVDLSRDSDFSCVVCHTLPMGAGSTHALTITGLGVSNGAPTFSSLPIPASTLGSAHLGISGNDGTGQNHFKVPHYRNELEKNGFFLDFGPSGPPSRAGFGVLHDGAIDGIARFIAEPAFDANTDQALANMVSFVLATRGDDFLRLQGLSGAPTGGIPPAAVAQDAHAAVGAQAVVPNGGSDFVADVLVDVANDDEIDLVAELRVNNQRRRYAHFDLSGGGRFMSDRASSGLVSLSALEGLGSDILYTGVHESTGRRIAIDRDEDGGLDGDEADFGADETNSNDNAFAGSSIPSYVGALHSFSTVSAAVAAVAPTAGKRGIVHIQGGDYAGPVTINKRVVLKKIVDPTTGGTIGGTVRIGT